MEKFNEEFKVILVCKKWKELEEACTNCRKCNLFETRTNVVFGVGNKDSKILFVGEGPGKNEDLKGEPFVGKAGKLLDRMLNKAGFDRHKNIYIANIVKCRPPNNRDPLPEEQENCIFWLREQFRLIAPKIVVCLGRIAALKLIKPDLKITKEHGLFFKKGKTIFMPMLHPAALLRNPNMQPEAFNDFLKLKKFATNKSLL